MHNGIMEKSTDPQPTTIQRCKGALLVFVLFMTALSGFLFFSPVFIAVFAIKSRSSRWIVDSIISTWFALAVGTYEYLNGVKIVVTGDVRQMSKNRTALIVMNHRTRVDWLFFFSVQARFGSLRRFKISLKDELKHVPGAGWAMQAAHFLFLKRNWDLDRVRIENSFKHLADYDYCPQLLLFPEGTDLAPSSREKSRQYAKKNDLEDYNYVLHPRTTGFTSVVNYMKKYNQLDQIIDVSVSYPQNVLQRETALIHGDLPREIVFHINCYDIKDVPSESEPALGRWLEERWREKEEYLKKFYENLENRNTVGAPDNGYTTAQNVEIERNTSASLIGAFLFWAALCSLILLFFIYSSLFRWYLLLASIAITCISTTVGFDTFLISLASR